MSRQGDQQTVGSGEKCETCCMSDFELVYSLVIAHESERGLIDILLSGAKRWPWIWQGSESKTIELVVVVSGLHQPTDRA